MSCTQMANQVEGEPWWDSMEACESGVEDNRNHRPKSGAHASKPALRINGSAKYIEAIASMLCSWSCRTRMRTFRAALHVASKSHA